MRKGQLQDRLVTLPPGAALQTGKEQRAERQKAHRSANTGRTVPKKEAKAKAAAAQSESKPKPRFGALPLQQACVLNQLQALSLKPPVGTIATGRENTTRPPVIHPAKPAQASAGQQHVKPVPQRLQKLRRARFAPSGDTDSEVESPLSQTLLAQTKIPSPLEAAICSDAQQARTPSRLQSASVCQAFPLADSPESMAMSTPVCGQEAWSTNSQLAVPMSCTSGDHSDRKPARLQSSNVSSPMCISPDLWATPQQLQWELPTPGTHNEAASHDSPAAEQEKNIPAKRWSVPTESQMQAAVLEFGLGTAHQANMAAQPQLSRLSDASGLDELVGRHGFADGHAYTADLEYLDDIELSQSPAQLSTESDEDSQQLYDVTSSQLQQGPIPKANADSLCQLSGEAANGQTDPAALDDVSSTHAGLQFTLVSDASLQRPAGTVGSLSSPSQGYSQHDPSCIPAPHLSPQSGAPLSSHGKRSSDTGPTTAEEETFGSPEKRVRVFQNVQPPQSNSGQQPGQQASNASHACTSTAVGHQQQQQQQAADDIVYAGKLMAACQAYAQTLQAAQQQHCHEQQHAAAPATVHQKHQKAYHHPQHQRQAHMHQPHQQQQQQQQVQQQRQRLLQQQALAEYQAALGRNSGDSHHHTAPAVGAQTHMHQTSRMQHCPHIFEHQQQLQQPLQQQQHHDHDHAQRHQQQQSAHQQVVQQGQPVVACNAAQIHNVYKAFQWQKDAIEFADACNQQAAQLATDAAQHAQQRLAGSASEADMDAPQGNAIPDIVKVFCEEAGSDAGYFRQFVAATYSRFWARYAPRLGQRPHCYEVVKGGSPCHIYFDTEFATESNPGVDGEAMLDKLLNACSRVLRQQFGVELKPEWVYELDSSHAGKFSRHLIICIPGLAFANNLAVGHLVSQILAQPEGMQILVQKKSDQPSVQQFTSLVDTAVYTRNRHFRLIWSCKAGKTHVLKPTPRFACSPGIERSQRELFMATLICNVDSPVKLLMADVIPNSLVFKSGKPAITDGVSGHVGYVVHGQHEVKVSHKADALDAEADAPPLTQERVQQWAEKAAGHVQEVATFRAGGLPAVVRTIAHCGFAGTVAYSLIGPGSHFCEHVGRCHQSNRVFFVVNFLTGMLAQKCHDPDCGHFRSTWTPLPQQLLSEIRL